MQVQPYLFFNGRCEEAAEFYRDNLGAQITAVMRFNEMPASEGPVIPPGLENKIMHMNVQMGDTTVMMSDGMSCGETKFEGFSLTLNVPNDAEAERLFALLAESGEIQMPMAQTFFASRFGTLADRFGVSWIVIVAQ